MMSTIRIPKKQIDTACRRLMDTGIWETQVNEGSGDRRMIFYRRSDRLEIMVAMEGSGCLFLEPGQNPDEFVFIKAGFQLIAARYAAHVLQEIAKTITKTKAHTQKRIGTTRSKDDGV